MDKDKTVNEALPNYERRYTFNDWLSMDDNIRAELYEGTLITLTAPNQKHQQILSEMHGQLWQFLKNKPCKVFPAPFGVRLNEKEDTVVEPDIIVVCDMDKLDGKVCIGAPDLVIEILSPSTAKRDMLIKYRLYQKAGVREYWIIDPEIDLVQVGVLSAGSYITSVYGSTDKVPVHILENFEIDLSEVFPD